MPERKLVKHGPSTFVVSLPKHWVDMHGFDKGDDIKYEETTESIRYFAKEYQEGKDSIEVDFTGLDRSLMMFFLRALYRVGYSEINIKFENDEVIYHNTGESVRVSSVISEEVQRLIGIEISDHSSDSITLIQMAEPKKDEFQKNLNRVFLLLDGAYNDILSALESSDFVGLEGVEEKHDAITKLVSHSIRSLNKLYHKDDRPYLMHMLMLIDVKIDLLKYFVRKVKDRGLEFSPATIDIFKDICDSHEIVISLWRDWDNKTANEFDKKREMIKEKVANLEADESLSVTYLEPILEIYRDILLVSLCRENL